MNHSSELSEFTWATLLVAAAALLCFAHLPAPLARSGEAAAVPESIAKDDAASSRRPVDRQAFTLAWNDIEEAVNRLNTTRSELGENMRTFAPWHVVSEPKQLRRRELYESAARDAELMAKRYRQMRDLER